MFQKYKKCMIGIVLFLCIGSLGWFVLFDYGVKWLKQELISAEVDLRQKGYEISYSNLKFKGSPFSISATLTDLHIKDPQGVFDWHGSKVKVKMRPWNFYTFLFTLSQEQRVSLLRTPFLPSAVLSLDGAHGIVTLTRQGTLNKLSLSMKQLSSLVGGYLQPIVFQSLSFQLDNLANPLNLGLSFTSTVKGLEAHLKGKPIEQPLMISFGAHLSGYQGKSSFPCSLAEWRDGGGVLEIVTAKVTWPPILMEGEGTLTFDKDMYPLGAFSSRIEGYQEVLDRLVEGGCIKKKKATFASFALDMLSKPDAKGNKILMLPLTLQDRRLSLGGIPLLKVGE